MKKYLNQILLLQGSLKPLLVAIAAIGLVASAEAGQTTAPQCNALVSVNNDLLLVNNVGTQLVRFTSDGKPKESPTVTPDGSKVVYFDPQATPETYTVADANGRQTIYPASRPDRDRDRAADDDQYAKGALMGVSWSSNDVVRLVKHISPSNSRFEYYQIPLDLSASVHQAARPAVDGNCILHPHGSEVACLEQEGHVMLGDISNGRTVFNQSGFEGIAPQESFTTGIDTPVSTHGDPSFQVVVTAIDKNRITLRITLPTGIWERQQVSSGDSMTVDLDSDEYGFFATVTDAQKGLVRIDVVKSDSGPYVFDPAIAWQPHERGLVAIRRTKAEAKLYVLQPRRDTHGQWTLVGESMLNLSTPVKAMRFLTPSLLLLQTSSNGFSELQINITHPSSGSGMPTVQLGSMTQLPSMLMVAVDGAPVAAPVLDWNCESPSGGRTSKEDGLVKD